MGEDSINSNVLIHKSVFICLTFPLISGNVSLVELLTIQTNSTVGIQCKRFGQVAPKQNT